MALVKCIECKTKLSDIADACPKCGRPVSAGSRHNIAAGKVQAIEQTGKRWKMAQMVSVVLIVAVVAYTVVVLTLDGTGREHEKQQQALLGLGVGAAALVLHGYIKLMIWWHHK